jgi:Domain of unknown function (DUF4410)
MKRSTIVIWVVIAVVLGMVPAYPAARPGDKDQGRLQDRYHVIQIGEFDVQPDVDFPPNYLASLPQQVLQRLKDSKKFTQVLAAGEKASQPDSAVMLLSGTVTGYDAGSRGKRYVGFGMGASRVFVTLKYQDMGTGQILYEDKVIGTLTGGVFGGAESKTVEELAKTIVTTTKLVLLTRPGESNKVVEHNAATETSNAAERQTVEMKGDLKTVENKLNELAGQGFRVADFRVTGNKSADVMMEKTATPPENYHYVVVHAILVGNVQKNMNKSAAEGYRLVRHTLAMLGGLTLIMEKPPVEDASKYEYRVSSSMRGSSAEKHLVEDQQQGFVLAEAGEVQGGIKVVLTEKAIQAQDAKR